MRDEVDSDATPISENQTHELLKDMTGDNTQCKRKASKYLASQLELARCQIIQRAIEIRKERDDDELKYDHMKQAVDDAFAPYHLMNNFLDIMNEYEYELKQEASSTNILDFTELEDE